MGESRLAISEAEDLEAAIAETLGNARVLLVVLSQLEFTLAALI